MGSKHQERAAAIIPTIKGELRQWVTIVYLGFGLNNEASGKVRGLNPDVIKFMAELSVQDFENIFEGMFNSIDSDPRKLQRLKSELDQVLSENGQQGLQNELKKLSQRRGREVFLKPTRVATAKQVKAVAQPEPERLPSEVERLFEFAEQAHIKEAELVSQAQERIDLLLIIHKQIEGFNLTQMCRVSSKYYSKHPEYRGARFHVLPINDRAYTDSSTEDLKRYASEKLILIAKVHSDQTYAVEAGVLIQMG